MKVFISSLNVPIGYTTPKFPLLYWPLGPTGSEYSQLVLYYAVDVWEFTVVWFMIWFVGFYLVSGLIASLNHILHYKRNDYAPNRLWFSDYLWHAGVIICSYMVTGAIIAFIAGSVVGLLISAIYKAGSMTMSTWIPFTWGLVGILYDICSSFLTSLITL